MFMVSRVKIAAKTVNPILWRLEKIRDIVMLVVASRGRGASIFGDVQGLGGGGTIKYCWVITPVEGDVRFDKKVLGEQAATIAQEYAECVAGLHTVA
jgi:hypothetical protein